jgi:ferritin-like metal-binding protein YciE
MVLHEKVQNSITMAKATKTVKSAPQKAPAKKAATPVKKAAAPKKAAPVQAPAKAPAKKAAPRKATATYDDAAALKEFFIDEIKDIYWAEKALVRALPKMRKAATSDTLKGAIDKHLAETQTQVTKLEEVFSLLGQKAQAKKCDAMDGLLKEANSIVEDTETGSATRDVGIILACQKVEHYEIATYGVLAQLAKTMDMMDVKNILGQILDEEKAADEALTQIAENDINIAAMQED